MDLKLFAAAVLLVSCIASPLQATVISSPDTYRADFDFSGDGLLPFTRIDAGFVVDSVLDSLVAGESFTFSLYDDESTLLASNTLTATFEVANFGRTFFLGAGELLDGVGFVTVTGNVGSFAIQTASVEGRQSPLAGFTSQGVVYTVVPEPSTALLIALGLGGLGLRRRRELPGIQTHQNAWRTKGNAE